MPMKHENVIRSENTSAVSWTNMGLYVVLVLFCLGGRESEILGLPETSQMEINKLWGFKATRFLLGTPLDENNAENKEYCADEQ